MFTSGIWTQKGVESQQAMLDKLFTDLRKDSAAAKAMMDSHPDERRAQEALDLKEVHVQYIDYGVRMDVKNSLRQRVAKFLINQIEYLRVSRE
jgi:carbamoylphosphate synthase small subunit